MSKGRSHNIRFCEMAAEVIFQAAVFWFTVGGSPKGSAVEPPLRKAAGTLAATRGTLRWDN
jgi:hypothetical protein